MLRQMACARLLLGLIVGTDGTDGRVCSLFNDDDGTTQCHGNWGSCRSGDNDGADTGSSVGDDDDDTGSSIGDDDDDTGSSVGDDDGDDGDDDDNDNNGNSEVTT